MPIKIQAQAEAQGMGGIRRLKRGQGEMNLGPVSYLDCIVFCVFLAPQLVWRVGFFDTVFCVLQALPFVREYMPGVVTSLWVNC